jgi:hypothetical protein
VYGWFRNRRMIACRGQTQVCLAANENWHLS